MTMKRISLAALSVALVMTGCGEKSAPDEVGGGSIDNAAASGSAAKTSISAADVTSARLTAASDEPEQWLTYGGSYDETRHSPLSKSIGTPSKTWVLGGCMT